MKCVCLILSVALFGLANGAYKLQERYSWTQMDFAFPSLQMKQQAIAAGDYIPTNALPVGVEHWGNKLFVTVPRWRDGTLYPFQINLFVGPFKFQNFLIARCELTIFDSFFKK